MADLSFHYLNIVYMIIIYMFIEINWPFCFICHVLNTNTPHDQLMMHLISFKDVLIYNVVLMPPENHIVFHSTYTRSFYMYIKLFDNLLIASTMLFLMMIYLNL